MKPKRPTNLSERSKAPILKGAVAALLSLCITLPVAVLPLSAAAAAEITTETAAEAANFVTDSDHSEKNSPEIIVTRPTASRVMEPSAIAPRISMTADTPVGRSRIYYPYPWGAMAVSLYLNGKRVLPGEVADIGGTVYVPVQRYADLFGNFKTTYEAATERVTISGTNLYITVRVGDPYITVNDRIFYTGSKVLSLGGWIFVPITAMSKAVGATVYIKKGYYEAYVTSGDPTSVATADAYYNSTDLYWLSRIISAEAKGEPLAGQIAVGNVVLNRTRSASFPNTVKEVIFDKKYGVQFSPVSNGTIYNTPVSSAVIAAKACLEGYTLSTRALYFFNPALTSATWISNNRPYIMTIGNHKFYG
ncbi:MAG: cell wall hydrolase [Clostridia bacterium]|nr:cell wall hydrolase [Clostridia bacterium]